MAPLDGARLTRTMRTSDALLTLDRHQALILAQLHLGRRLLAQPSAETHGELAKVRWQLVRLLRAYQLFKHVEIFDPLIASTNPHRQAAARNLKVSCIETGEGYQAHTRRWSANNIAAEWPAYVLSSEAMARSIEQHLAAERAAVASVLTGIDRTRKA